jgi:hypothetical protein
MDVPEIFNPAAYRGAATFHALDDLPPHVRTYLHDAVGPHARASGAVHVTLLPQHYGSARKDAGVHYTTLAPARTDELVAFYTRNPEIAQRSWTILSADVRDGIAQALIANMLGSGSGGSSAGAGDFMDLRGGKRWRGSSRAASTKPAARAKRSRSKGKKRAA